MLSEMSRTLSSGLNSLAAVVLEDIIKPINKTRNAQLPDHRAAIYSKLLALFFGILTIALSFLAMRLGAILTTFYRVFGVVGGPVVSVFLLGMLTKKANARGVYAGLLCGLAIGLWIAIGAQVYRPPVSLPPVSTSGCAASSNATVSSAVNATTVSTPIKKSYEGLALYKLSFLWYSTACSLTTFLVGLIVSYIFPGNHDSEAVDSRLLFHFNNCFRSHSERQELGHESDQDDGILTDHEIPGTYREQKSTSSLLNVTAV